MNKKYIVNNVYYFFAWGTQTREDFYYTIEHNDINHVILFGPEEHEIGYLFEDFKSFKKIVKYLKKKKITYKVVVSACKNKELNNLWVYKDQKHIWSWESFFAFDTLFYNLQNNIKPFQHNSNISKHFVSLNGRAHPWRCMFVDYLYKEGLFDYGYVSWHNSDNWDYVYDFKYWKPIQINFDKRWLSNTDGILDHKIPPQEQFQDSLFSVISESHNEILKITEKTYLPIYHKRPFIVYAAQNFHLFLKQQGFLLFDEIFDYSFDNISDNEERCIAMIQETKKILNYNPNELYKDLKPKIDYNYKNLLKIANKKFIDHKIVEIINNIPVNDIDYNAIMNLNLRNNNS